MSVTDDYGLTHNAFLSVAAAHGITPSDVRLLVALQERDGEGDTLDVQLDGHMNATQVRRSSLTLRQIGLIDVAASDGGETRPGVRVVMKLTDDGAQAARQALMLAVGP